MNKNFNNKFWAGKKVVVTGHTGFTGSCLCIFLKLLGAKVTGYALQPKTKPSLFKLGKIDRILEKSIYADVRNFKRLFAEIKKSKANIIFHLAAQPLVRHSYIEPKETFETNFLGTLNILESVRKIKTIKSTVIITTDKVYDIKKNKVFKETDLLGGSDPYSGSKVSCEFLFSSYISSFFQNNTKQKIATVRAGNVIGGGHYSNLHTFVLHKITPSQLQKCSKHLKIDSLHSATLLPICLLFGKDIFQDYIIDDLEKNNTISSIRIIICTS